MTPQLNCLDQTVQIRGHNIGFDERYYYKEKLSNTPLSRALILTVLMVDSHDMIHTSPFATILYHPCQFYQWTGNQTGMNIRNTILILLNATEPL